MKWDGMTREQVIQASQLETEANLAEGKRLEGIIPHGLLYQIPLKQLQSMGQEEARKWIAAFYDRRTAPSMADATNLHR